MTKSLRTGLSLGLLLIICTRAEAASAPHAQHLQDAAESEALMEPALGLMQISMARLAGDEDKVSELYQANYDHVERMLKQNPESSTGLYLRGSYKNIVREKSGAADFKKLIAVTTKRIGADPTYSRNYEMRADGYKELGKFAKARADYQKAMTYARDSKKVDSLKKDIENIDEMTEAE